MKDHLFQLLRQAFARAAEKAAWPVREPPAFVVEIPNERAHGDFASNVALVSAKTLQGPPRKIAEALREALEADQPDWVEKVEIAGPGFLNFYIRPAGWCGALDRAVAAGERYGHLTQEQPRRVLLEFVSANPTGPLHVGHGRGCAYGDALARVLTAAGHHVTKEYYVNDAGLQMETLGRSLLIRYWQRLGKDVALPDDHYQGDYLKELAAQVAVREGNRYRDAAEEDVLTDFAEEAATVILGEIVEDMRNFRLEFDHYVSEREFYASGKVDEALGALREKGFVQDREGATWFLSSHFGDEKDRVVVRENGAPTYFASDIAYHREKFKRGYDLLIDIWGADHHGYIPRLRGAMEAFGMDVKRLQVQLVQFVSLVRGGKPLSMSTRAGTFDTLSDLVAEVGVDAARFLFLMRSVDSALDFDLDLAKKQTMENPVFYVQYAHARICSFFGKAEEAGISFDPGKPLDPALLGSAEEIELVRQVAQLPDVIEGCARSLQVQLLPHYLLELARTFHSYYTAKDPASGGARFKVVDPEEPAASGARLKLAQAVALALRNGLQCLGVSAPERMERLEEPAAEG